MLFKLAMKVSAPILHPANAFANVVGPETSAILACIAANPALTLSKFEE
jgi:hypothetical protein